MSGFRLRERAGRSDSGAWGATRLALGQRRMFLLRGWWGEGRESLPASKAGRATTSGSRWLTVQTPQCDTSL